jgi:transposase
VFTLSCYDDLIMTYGYSDDLRQAALNYYDSENITQKQLCAIFGISLKTFSNWIRGKKQGVYSRRVNQKKKGATKIDESQLREYIQQNPDAYNHEIGSHFSVHGTTIHYACKRLGISRKKRSICTKKETLNNGKNFKRN